MILDTGIATFRRPPDTVGHGNMPPDSGSVYLETWYGERTVGTARYFAARQANDRVDTVIRIIRQRVEYEPRADDECILRDGLIYRVLQVQSLRDEDAGENVLDISLERIGEKYGARENP